MNFLLALPASGALWNYLSRRRESREAGSPTEKKRKEMMGSYDFLPLRASKSCKQAC